MKTINFKIGAVGMILLAGSAVLADVVTKEINYDLPATSDRVQILNLTGKVEVVPSRDNEIHVRGEVVAKHSSKSKAQELLDKIKFDFTERSGQDILTVVYPVDEYAGFIYNPDGIRSWNSNTTTKYMGERVKISSRASRFGNWANVHTKLVIELPARQEAFASTKMGGIKAQDLDNELTLDTSSGRIEVSNSKGSLVADSGSGKVTIDNFDGNVNADTGSGSISLSDIDGDVFADTGSGGVTVEGVTGEVEIDTGSGGVRVKDYAGGESLKVDTGSGGVRVYGDLSNVNDLVIDTGSGSVVLESTQPPSLELDIDTGSGGITVDLPDLDVKRDKRGVFIGTAGNGRGSAEIDTGSGSVRIRMAEGYKFERSSSASKKEASEQKAATENDEKEDKELTRRLRSALNADKDIRNSDLSITTKGDRAIIKGTVDSVWTFGKVLKIANEVDGVESVNIDIETED